MPYRAWLAVCLTICLTVTPFVAAPAPAMAAPVAFTSTAVNQNGGNCMEVPDGNANNNVQLVQRACVAGTARQNYTFNPVAGTADQYTIATLAAGKCVDIFGVSTADNATVIQWTCNSGNNQKFRLVPVTFQTVSSPQVFFDPGFNVLDGTVFSDGGVNYLYYKNLSNGLLFGARSNTLNPGSFTTYTSGMLQGNAIEAPIVAKSLTSNTFYLCRDSFSPVNGEFYAWQTGSISGGSWTAMNQRDYAQPLNSKHASIAQITAAEYNAAVSRWGLPAWSRLKSYNYPGRYWRHLNFAARIDPYPFDPYQDEQWTVVPGLADPAGVSFRSVNFPDRYLRQSSFALRIDPNDGTAAFRGDATFYRVAGLGNSSWASFRSFSQPTRYIRHFNLALRLDVLTASSPALDREDATFRVQS